MGLEEGIMRKFISTMAMGAFAATAGAADIVVSPNGSIATPQQALKEVRRLRATGRIASNATATVSFAPGVYRLSAPLAVGAEDSHVVFEGAADGRTVFSGARAIGGFRAGVDGIWRTPVPKGMSFSQLWVNGRRAVRAQSPNKGYYYIRQAVGEAVDPETGKLADLDKVAYEFSRENAAELAVVPKDELKDVIVHAIYAWDDDFVRPTFADPKTGIVKFLTAFVRSPMWGKWMTRCRFENFRAALDAPGEWFLDRRKDELLYIPRPGETPERTVAEAPVVTTLVDIKGAGAAFVEDVSFRRIAFGHQGWTCGRAFFTGQGVGALSEAMVITERARHVTFEDCEFAHTSAYALWWRDACFDGAVIRSHFHDLGAGGVRISHSDTWRKGTYDLANISRRITVDDCVVRDSGHVFPGGVGILLQHAYDCRILHNEIFDCLYTGISHGWTWGYGKQPAGGHEIAFNHIHDLGLNEMCDMGGIYSLGPSPKSRVHDNWIHDIWSYQYTGSGGTGLYTDEGSTGILLENNLVHDTQTSCLNQHYGRENVFRNNIFAYPAVKAQGGPIPVLIRHRGEPHLSCVVSNNIVILGKGRTAVGKPNSGLEKDTVFGGNFYVPDGADLSEAFAGLPFAGWQKLGMDAGSAVGDAKFRDPEKRDFTLAADSPVFALGFKAFDWRRAGLRSDDRRAAVAALPRRPRTPAFEPEHVPAKTSFRTSFEAAKPGAPCPTALGPCGGEIRVTDKEARTGRHSLAYRDKAGQTSYLPHSRQGLERLGDRLIYAFAIKYEEKTSFGFDLRDYGGRPANGQFATGPQVTVCKSALRAGSFVSKLAKPGQWIVCRIIHDLGPADVPGKATWYVEIIDEEGEIERSDTFGVNSDYRQPNWAGIMSWADEDTVFYIDDIGYSWKNKGKDK